MAHCCYGIDLMGSSQAPQTAAPRSNAVCKTSEERGRTSPHHTSDGPSHTETDSRGKRRPFTRAIPGPLQRLPEMTKRWDRPTRPSPFVHCVVFRYFRSFLSWSVKRLGEEACVASPCLSTGCLLVPNPNPEHLSISCVITPGRL